MMEAKRVVFLPRLRGTSRRTRSPFREWPYRGASEVCSPISSTNTSRSGSTSAATITRQAALRNSSRSVALGPPFCAWGLAWLQGLASSGLGSVTLDGGDPDPEGTGRFGLGHASPDGIHDLSTEVFGVSSHGSMMPCSPASSQHAVVTKRLFPASAGSKCSEEQRASQGKGEHMSVARVTELSVVSETGFEDAIRQGVARATSTLRGVQGAWIKDMNVLIEDNNVTGYKVNMEVTFVLEDS